MDKRIHLKQSARLTCRNYLFHFKWPLLGFILISILILFNKMQFTSNIVSPLEFENKMEICFELLSKSIETLGKKSQSTRY